MRFWNSASVAAHAMLKHMSQKDEATVVFHKYFNAGCCDMRNLLVSALRSAVDFFKKVTIEGPIAPQADMAMGVKIVLFPASSSSLRTTSWLRFPQLRIDPIQSSSCAPTE